MMMIKSKSASVKNYAQISKSIDNNDESIILKIIIGSIKKLIKLVPLTVEDCGNYDNSIKMFWFVCRYMNRNYF